MRFSKLVFLFLLPSVVWTQTLGYALGQIEGEVLISAALNGAGVKIGIIDGGFLGAQKEPNLAVHFDEKRIRYYKDFISPEMTPYGGSAKLNDDHGTHVWELIGGINSTTGIQMGLANKATYYLARTDHGVRERREEEKYLIQAMDEMIRLGVRLFNVSLGYADGFNNPIENYVPSQIDGHSTWITRSLDSLLSLHDVLVIISAGNDGNTRWKTLSAPADSKNVITVGATKLSAWESMNYSSVGPANLDYVKPELSCYSPSGTSFTAPVITGLAACIMQYDSTLSPSRVKEILIKSSHLYPYANNLTGYGVPSSRRVLEFLRGVSPDSIESLHSKGNAYSLRLDASVANSQKLKATIYHKKGWVVTKTEHKKFRKLLRLKRPGDVTQSTILIGKKAFEIFWKD
jgi:subtilisin family serine protease